MNVAPRLLTRLVGFLALLTASACTPARHHRQGDRLIDCLLMPTPRGPKPPSQSWAPAGLKPASLTTRSEAEAVGLQGVDTARSLPARYGAMEAAEGFVKLAAADGARLVSDIEVRVWRGDRRCTIRMTAEVVRPELALAMSTVRSNGLLRSCRDVIMRTRRICGREYLERERQCSERPGMGAERFFGYQGPAGGTRAGLQKYRLVAGQPQCAAAGTRDGAHTTDVSGTLYHLKSERADLCERSALCKADGQCALVRGECAANSAEACERSTGCEQSGRCTVRNGRCVVSSETDCARSRACKTQDRCSPRAGRCVQRCAERSGCRMNGTCAQVQGRCAATEAGMCRASALCGALGRCTPRGGRCVATSDEDCAGSVGCEQDGRCAFDGERCSATR